MIAAVPDSSCTETKEQMLEASIISTNWLDSAGQTRAKAGCSTTCFSTCHLVMASASPASICDL